MQVSCSTSPGYSTRTRCDKDTVSALNCATHRILIQDLFQPVCFGTTMSISRLVSESECVALPHQKVRCIYAYRCTLLALYVLQCQRLQSYVRMNIEINLFSPLMITNSSSYQRGLNAEHSITHRCIQALRCVIHEPKSCL